MKFQALWREKPHESTKLYPGLVVCDNRVTGSITIGRSRLPVWAFIHELVMHGWDAANSSYDIDDIKAIDGVAPLRQEGIASFLYYLMEMRGEFGRLILMLAGMERADDDRSLLTKMWWERKGSRARLRAQLQRCIEALDQMEEPST